MKWYQHKDDLYITVDHRDVKGEKITFENNKINICFKEGDDDYQQELTLLKEIDPEKSNYTVAGYCINIHVVKKESGFWKFLTENDKLNKNIKVDWNNFVDPEEEEEEKA